MPRQTRRLEPPLKFRGRFLPPAAADHGPAQPQGQPPGHPGLRQRTDSTGIRIYDFDTKKTTASSAQVYDLRDFRWAGDDRVVFAATRTTSTRSGLYVAPWDHVDRPVLLNQRDAVQVIGSPRERPDTSSCGCGAPPARRAGPDHSWKSTSPIAYSRPFDENPNTVVSSVKFPPADSVRGWMQDRKGEIRYAIALNKGKTSFSGATARNGPWLTSISTSSNRWPSTPIPPKSSSPG